jgi:acyl carrier protein
MTSEDKLRAAFVEGLGLEGQAIDWSTLEYRGIPEWDSVAHMQMVAEIEDAFDIMLEIEDVVAMSSYPMTREILSKYDVTFD